MPFDLTGKLALVTGGARGIGREISLLLAQAGAEVVVNFNKSKDQAESLLQEIVQQGRKAEVFQADIASPDAVKGLFEHLQKKFGRLDILVNNAGVIRDNLLLSTELSDWDRVLDLNLRGAFLCTRYAAEMMLVHHSGKIINIASTGAIRGGRGQTNYAASKSGVMGFTKSLAREVAGKNITVNAVAPGLVETEMAKQIREEMRREYLKQIPMGRFAEPREIAEVVAFLVSDLAGYITGQTIHVNGGWYM
jgi:3-oxoacyl-[acyl-carrier protein] reductase